ncbi:circularly permuted type 2 ATP-grasp protein [Marinospirillum sp.]|uniref:circularly permuted type 2 ATP-grasp protein n=1 Tax=Marinospirillum sp. TaxID=2183934 RepID=UPI0028706D71|nr:circularly permuted type 2 ATP-grasp protein [Marinospirillum sp.]MDR9468343.1 circularly permuted type 2 ATP-grasp protein [Marinospirillum sp.]
MLNLSSFNQALQQLLQNYPDARQHDELINEQGEFRAHWQPVLDELAELGQEGLHHCSEATQDLLHENGVTFNVYEDEEGQLRSWQLDPLPFVISTDEWEKLEQGLIQRSRLLEALVDDLYGERRVIHEGILPPELVYTHPAWLFSAAGHQAIRERPWILLHGTDITRDHQGEWRIMGDWTQAPSGAGYALENRVLLARALPNLYRDAPLRRLASFLQAQHRCLAELARKHRDNPNIVLLTPGQGSPGYFEHAWLANYMNFSLVEGADLVVRDGQVSMRTLGGLKAVDVIVRHINDPWCDPLELRGDSLLGVPGLMQAARQGDVEIANALGVGVLEHPALACFMPELCDLLLGEKLLLKSRNTLWCGEPENLEKLLTLPAGWQFKNIQNPGQLLEPQQFSTSEQKAFLDELQTAPHLYVAQRPFQAATSPCFDSQTGQIGAQPVNLRFFSLADPSDIDKPVQERRQRIMPGGLAWIAEPGTPVMDSSQVKDIWVMAPVPQPHVSLLLQARGPIRVTRDSQDLPSRVADSLFWMGRYGERLDSRSRLLRETLSKLLEEGHLPLQTTLLPDLFTALSLPLPDLENLTDNKDSSVIHTRTSLQFLHLRNQLLEMFAENTPDGLPWLFSYFLRNSRAIRDHLGDDSWRTLNHLHRKIQGLQRTQVITSGRSSLEEVITHLAAFFGLCNETMPHHYGWRFMDLGRFTERVISSLELLKLALITARKPGIPLWEVVLSTTDNLTVYRRRYRSQLHPAAILDLLLFDESNPRSIGYMLKRLERQIEKLPQPEMTPFRNLENRLIIEATSTLHLVDPDSLLDPATSEIAHTALEGLLDALLRPLHQLSDAISHSHFSHVETPRQLVSLQTKG